MDDYYILFISYSNLLQTGWSGYHIPVEARVSAPVQTGPGAHPTLCTVATGYLYRGETARALPWPPTQI